MGLVLVVVSSNINWGKERWRLLMQTDAKGYYAYLPAVFVFEDLNLEWWEDVEVGQRQNRFMFDYRTTYKGNYIIKYFSGTAAAQLPFFLAAHGVAHASDFEPDGFSKPYPIATSLAAIFYALLGLFFLNKLLSLYRIREWPKTLTLAAALFGTNLFYYTIVEPGMSHVYSFAFVAIFLFFAKRLFQRNVATDAITLALALGMVMLIRPVNGLIVLSLPFVAGSWSVFYQRMQVLLRAPLQLLGYALAFACPIAIQLLLYKAATGDFFVYAYAHETFNFSDPHILDFLISYKKGLFVYTPIFLVAMAGLVVLWKRSKFELVSWLAVFLVITYVLSSWWLWWYGGSFGSRVFVEFIPLFMILLALGLNQLPSLWMRHALSAIAVLLIMLCQTQTYQYRYGQIHWEDMTKESYWDVFLRLDKL